MRPRSGFSGEDARTLWRYAVETDLEPTNVSVSRQNKHTFEYDSADRFIRFDRPLAQAWFTMSVNASRRFLAVADQCDVVVYDLETGAHEILQGHTSNLSIVAFSPTDPDLLVSSAEGHMLARPNGESKEEIILWRLSQHREGPRQEPVNVDAAAIAAVRAVLQELNGKLFLAETEEEELRTNVRNMISRFETSHKIPMSSRLNGRLSASFQSPLFSNSGEHLIYLPGSRPKSNGDDRWDIGLYSLDNDTSHFLSGHRDAIMWIGFSPDDLLVASAGWDGSFRVHKVSGEQLWKWETDRQNWAGTFSPDGSHFAGTDGAGIIRVWNLETGAETAKDDFGPGWCRMIDWSPDGRYLAVGSEEYGRIGIYTVINGQLDRLQQRKLSLRESKLDEVEPPIRRMLGRFLSVHSLKFLKSESSEPAGTVLAHSTTTDQGVEVFDFDTGEGWRFVPNCQGGCPAPSVSRDGRAALTSWLWVEGTRDFGVISADGVRFWHLNTSSS